MITYATDHAAFEATISNWLGTFGTLNDHVRQADYDGVRPATPFATFQIISDGTIEGVDSEDFKFNEATNRMDASNSGQRRMTVQIVFYTSAGKEDLEGQGARILLNRSLAALRNETVRQTFNDNGLGFLQVLGPPRQFDEQLEDGWERRMQVDVEFGYTSLLLDQSVGEEGGQTFIETFDGVDLTTKE